MNILGDAAAPIIGVVGLLLALVLIGAFVAKRYKVPKADEAIIVTGRKSKDSGTGEAKLKVVQTGGVFVLPIVQDYSKVSLRSRQVKVNAIAQTSGGITIKAQAVAIVKIGGNADSIRLAAQRFLNEKNEISDYTTEVLTGSLRSIIGQMTPESLIQERAKFSALVLEETEATLSRQGLEIDSFQIQEIDDEQDYLKNMGRPQSARLLAAANIAEAENAQASQEARIRAEAVIIEKELAVNLRKAQIQQETDEAKARAEAARPRIQAIEEQGIIQEQEKTAQRRAQLREAELNSEVRKEADAEKYRVLQIAEASKQQEIAQAEAEKFRRISEAEALEAENMAIARGIQARGEAEAMSTRLKSEALREDAQTLIQQQLIESLPKIAAEYARPYASIDNLTVLSGADGSNGLSKNVVGGFAEINESLKATLGMDLTGILAGLGAGKVLDGLGRDKSANNEYQVGDAKDESVAEKSDGRLLPKSILNETVLTEDVINAGLEAAQKQARRHIKE